MLSTVDMLLYKLTAHLDNSESLWKIQKYVLIIAQHVLQWLRDSIIAEM